MTKKFYILLKEKGNAAYKEKRYKDAISLWEEAEVMLQRRGDTTSPLAIASRSNAIMAFMQLQLYERVVKESTLLLQDDPRHFKTLARRGTARERLANNRGSTASAQERKELHNMAVEDMREVIELLNSVDGRDSGQERLKKECEQSLERLSKYDDDHYTQISENLDSTSTSAEFNKMNSGLGQYLSMNLTPIGEHPRIPKSSMKYEMLAVRLMASLEVKQMVTEIRTGEKSTLDFSEEGRGIINKILTTVAQVPFCLFPANGSNVMSPPITVSLLAFYMRACLSEKAWKEFDIEEFCKKATGEIISDDEAYAIATHGYREVENKHNPLHGHGKSFGQSAKGCNPCCCRLTREGKKDWGAGLQQAAHFGKIEGLAFVLNRLLEKIDGNRKKLVDYMLETDSAGCNTMMHAANDTSSGYSWLSIRMLVHAASFSTPNPDEKEKAVRTVLNKADSHGFTPALASCSLMNRMAMETLAQVGARLYDDKINGRASSHSMRMVQKMTRQLDSMGGELELMIRTLKSTSDEICSYCGKSPETKLSRCGRCFLAKYCNGACQKRHYKKHKFVCTSAKVDQNLDWFASNISAPQP